MFNKEMKMEFETFEFRLSGHWASAIINGDYSGLSDDEAEQLNSWINNNTPGGGHFDGFSEDDDSLGFCRDNVSGLMADCFRVRYLQPIKRRTV
jgi:hypothetical protein